MSQLYPRVPAVAAAAALALTIGGCGGQTRTLAPAPTVTVTSEPTPDASVTVATDEPAAATRKRLPSVVGKNLQAAQDYLQARGFYVLDDQDATGQKRLQIYDRNWVVVRQVPAAGKRIRTDTLITLFAKKHGE